MFFFEKIAKIMYIESSPSKTEVIRCATMNVRGFLKDIMVNQTEFDTFDPIDT